MEKLDLSAASRALAVLASGNAVSAEKQFALELQRNPSYLAHYGHAASRFLIAQRSGSVAPSVLDGIIGEYNLALSENPEFLPAHIEAGVAYRLMGMKLASKAQIHPDDLKKIEVCFGESLDHFQKARELSGGSYTMADTEIGKTRRVIQKYRQQGSLN